MKERSGLLLRHGALLTHPLIITGLGFNSQSTPQCLYLQDKLVHSNFEIMSKVHKIFQRKRHYGVSAPRIGPACVW